MTREPYYADDAVTIFAGDCLEVLAGMGAASVDAVVTDPPYGLEFMGKDWDRPWQASSVGRGARVAAERAAELTPRGQGHATSGGAYLAAGVDSVRVAGKPFQDWCEVWARECLRVLKPGGYMLAFGGSRTWHRLAAAVEDAGFEIRDSIAWLYGSGFPKSLDVSKAIDKAAGAARQPGVPRVRLGDSKPYAHNAQDSDEAIFGERGARLLTKPASDDAATWAGWGTALKPAFEPIVVGRKPPAGTVASNVLTHGTGALNIDACRVAGEWSGEQHAAGRWPTNVVLDDTQAADLDRQTGVLTSGANPTRRGSDKFRDAYGEFTGQAECTPARGADSGGASRFFPTFHYEAKAPTAERPRSDDGTAHPTVKPLDLMRWLVRLVTPPGGLVLDPFLGSGTTAEACVMENLRCVGIEREPAYLPLAVARLSKPIAVGLDFGGIA